MFDLSKLTPRDFVLQNQILAVLLEEVRNECGPAIVGRILERAEDLFRALEESEPDDQARAIFVDAQLAVKEVSATIVENSEDDATQYRLSTPIKEALEAIADAKRYESHQNSSVYQEPPTLSEMINIIRSACRPR